MRIAIAYRPPMRRWQRRLADELARAGHKVSFRAGAGPRLGFGIAAPLVAQQRLFGPRPSLFDAMPPDDQADPSEAADLVIALDGGVDVEDTHVLEPVFDGVTGEAAMIAMLCHAGSPRCVAVRARRDGEDVAIVTAHLAIEDPTVLSRALDQALARLVTLIQQGVRRFERGGERPPRQRMSGRSGRRESGSPSPNLPHPALADAEASFSRKREKERASLAPLTHIGRSVFQKVAARLTGASRGPNHWRVGYRRVDAEPDVRGGVWPEAPFTILPDDGARFYADPVPFEHEGRGYIFVEDYPYATGKGVIAVVEIAADGTASAPRTVLEQPCHLSYSFLLRHGGEIYMLPETSGARRVQLFRAAAFPDRWVADRVLLDGVVAADATLVEHDGRWWMFATLSDDGGSSWDQLCLFHAPDLFGPWTPHADNPVLVDAGAARPAGAMWREDGALMRVAQDCRAGYGRGLAICRVDRVDETGYAQTVVARLAPPDGLGADGVHTLGRAGDLEVIDLRFPSVRFSRAGR